MRELFDFFNQGWVGSLIGVIGIALGIVGIFSYKISKSVAKPSYQKTSLRLIGREEDNLPREVTVTYKGKEVDRLTKTTLILWNNGTETLDGRNVVDKDPISVSFDDQDRILSHKVLRRTKSANAFVISTDEKFPNKLFLSFDYLDPGDGVAIELLHDSVYRYPKLSGVIRGVPNGFVDQGRIPHKAKYKLRGPLGLLLNRPKIIYITTVSVGLGLTIFGLLPQEVRNLMISALSESSEQKSITEQPMFFIIFGLLYASMPAYVLWTRRKKYPKQLEVQEIEP